MSHKFTLFELGFDAQLCSSYSTCIACVRINFFRALGQRELEAH